MNTNNQSNFLEAGSFRAQWLSGLASDNPEGLPTPMSFEAASHRGNKQETNEDHYYVQELVDGSLLVAVADGKGGGSASSLAIRAVPDSGIIAGVDGESLGQVVTEGHNAVREYSATHQGMRTALTAAIVRRESVSWAHMGDCRLYLLHEGTLTQLTSDQSDPLDDGYLCPTCSSTLQPEIGQASLGPDDILLMCSDGLYKDVSHEAITAILNLELSLWSKADVLVRTALMNGGNDNITVTLVTSRYAS